MGLRAVVILGWHVAKILLIRVVLYVEICVCLLTQQPKISHVHGARPLSLDGIIYDAYRRRVVDVDGGGRLRVARLFQCEADDSGVHGVEEEGSQFGFSCRGSHTLEDCALCQNGAIEADGATVFGDGSKEKIASGSASGFGGGEVTGIGVDVEDHV